MLFLSPSAWEGWRRTEMGGGRVGGGRGEGTGTPASSLLCPMPPMDRNYHLLLLNANDNPCKVKDVREEVEAFSCLLPPSAPPEAAAYGLGRKRKT